MANAVFWSPRDEKEVEFPSSAVLSSSVPRARDMGWKMRSKCAPKTLPKQWIIYFLIKCSNRLLQPVQPAYLWLRSTTKEPLSPQPDAAHVSEKPSNLLLRNCDSSVWWRVDQTRLCLTARSWHLEIYWPAPFAHVSCTMGNGSEEISSFM